MIIQIYLQYYFNKVKFQLYLTLKFFKLFSIFIRYFLPSRKSPLKQLFYNHKVVSLYISTLSFNDL